jgi:hypothetical protein
MKNELHPIELLILALLLVASAVRELLVAVIALVITLAEWRRPRPMVELPRIPRQLPPAPAAPPHVHPILAELELLTCHQLRQIAGVKSKNPAERAFAERQAINAPLQGAAADIIRRAMVRLPAALEGAGLKARMLLQVHDELVFEAPEDEAAATCALAARVMEEAPDPAARLSVPLIVEAKAAANWATAH